MNLRRPTSPLSLVCLGLALLASAPSAHAGFGDALKKKVSDKAGQKAGEAVDKAVDKPKPPAPPAAGTPSDETGAAKPAATGQAAGASSEKVSTVSTKFDFVPGDSVMFLDDFTQDELGEFPVRWRLTQGTFEVAEMEGQRWLRVVSNDGWVQPKLPAMKTLPEFWTLEFDFWSEEPNSNALTVRGLNAESEWIWEAAFPAGENLAFRTGSIQSHTPFEGDNTGRHHVMLMGRGTAVKVYVDQQRMASVPEVSDAVGPAAKFDVRLWASSKPMITNVRFAEGCRPAKDMLAEGKLVTHGIHFASGSDVVLPESAPVLRQVSAYMVANPAVKLKITGHTDNVGAPASNLDLSKRRAAAVAGVLTAEFGIAAERFTADGKGDTRAVASNAKPEGRAMNRRVEFVKL